MAGVFTSYNEIRPGVYFNVKGQKQSKNTLNKGVVVIPFFSHTWGPAGKFIEVSADSPDDNRSLLGYSLQDGNPNMIMIRLALMCAEKVLVYICKEGIKASIEKDNITATAKYGGTRGNTLRYSIAANPESGFDISIYLEDQLVEKVQKLTTADELAAAGSKYIDFTGTGDLTADAGTTLLGGTDGTATNADITAFLDSLENAKFEVLSFPADSESGDDLKAACKGKVQYLLEEIGKQVRAVVPDYKADMKEIVSVTNSYKTKDGADLTKAQACARVAGMQAQADYTKTLTQVVIEDAASIIGVKTHEEAKASINNGEFFFSYSDDGEVVVEYDINSLTTFTDTTPEVFRKNKTVRVLQSQINDFKSIFKPGKFSNNEDDWAVMEGLGLSKLKEYADSKVIEQPEDGDFTIVKAESTGERIVIGFSEKLIESAEKIYVNVTVR